MPPPSIWSEQAQFRPHRACVADARAFVSGHLVRHELPYLVDDVTLVVSELVTNAVVHARTEVTVVIAETRSSVRVSVEDQSQLAPVLGPAQVAGESGRGLQIVGRCSTEWGTMTDARGSKTVWAQFPTRPSP